MLRSSFAVRLFAAVALVGGGASVVAQTPPVREATTPTAPTAISDASADPVALTLDLRTGTPVRQRMSVVQSMTQESPASIPVTLGTSIVLDVTHRVLEAPPAADRFVVQTTLERVAVRVQQAMMATSVTMDSQHPESIRDTPMAAPFKRLFAAVGTPLRWELTPDGRFVTDGPVAEVVIQRAGGTATPLMSFLRQMIRPVPDEPVAIGEPWAQTVPGEEIGREDDLALTWAVTEVTEQGTSFRISATERVVDEPVSVGAGLEGRMSRTGSTAGTATAVPGGWISRLQTRQTTEGSADVPQGATMVQVTFTSSVNTRVRRIVDDEWPDIVILTTGEVSDGVILP